MSAPENAGIWMPAEWEPHSAVHLAWPSNTADWPGKFSPIPWVFTEFIRQITLSETVRLAVTSPRHEAQARRYLKKAGVSLAKVQFIATPLDRGWMRDISPFFVQKTRGNEMRREAVHFSFTGWAKYENHQQDACWPEIIAKRLDYPLISADYRRRRVVLEGGAVDGNGAGTLLVTEECLLDGQVQSRNPGFTREDYGAVFAQYLGIQEVIWLGKGIVGDDTHGHIDDFCRFVNDHTVVLCRESHGSDENHGILEENWERLSGLRLTNGQSLECIALPMPSPVVFDGMRLPASYANFLITNERVLVPTFNDPNDRIALGILAECFPERVVTGIHAVDLVWGLGTLHCLSHEEPA